MSIIIKGIDMPETNEIRMIAIKSNGEVFFNTVKDGTPDKTKMSQAIQIPKKHGRLIDAKVFADTICQAIQSGDLIQKSIWEWIADAPTILEEEK